MSNSLIGKHARDGVPAAERAAWCSQEKHAEAKLQPKTFIAAAFRTTKIRKSFRMKHWRDFSRTQHMVA